MQDERTTLDLLALAAATAEYVAEVHVHAALETAADSLDRLGVGLTLEQHAVLMAHLGDAIKKMAITTLVVAAGILKQEREEREQVASVVASLDIETLAKFAARVAAESMSDEFFSTKVEADLNLYMLDGAGHPTGVPINKEEVAS